MSMKVVERRDRWAVESSENFEAIKDGMSVMQGLYTREACKIASETLGDFSLALPPDGAARDFMSIFASHFDALSQHVRKDEDEDEGELVIDPRRGSRQRGRGHEDEEKEDPADLMRSYNDNHAKAHNLWRAILTGSGDVDDVYDFVYSMTAAAIKLLDQQLDLHFDKGRITRVTPYQPSIAESPTPVSSTAGAGAAGAGAESAGSISFNGDARSSHAQARAQLPASVRKHNGTDLKETMARMLAKAVPRGPAVIRRVSLGLHTCSDLSLAARLVIGVLTTAFPRAKTHLHILSLRTFAPFKSDNDITTFCVDAEGDATQDEVRRFDERFGTDYRRTFMRYYADQDDGGRAAIVFPRGGSHRPRKLRFTTLHHTPLLGVLMPHLFPGQRTIHHESTGEWNENATGNVIYAFGMTAERHGLSVVSTGTYGAIINVPDEAVRSIKGAVQGLKYVVKLSNPAWTADAKRNMEAEVKMHERGSEDGFGPVLLSVTTQEWGASGFIAIPCMLQYDATLHVYLFQRVPRCTEKQKKVLAKTITAKLEEHLRAVEAPAHGATICSDQKPDNALVSVPPGKALGDVSGDELDLVLTDFGGDFCRSFPRTIHDAVGLLCRVALAAKIMECTRSIGRRTTTALIVFEDKIAELEAELKKPRHGILGPIISKCTMVNNCDGVTFDETDSFAAFTPLHYIKNVVMVMDAFRDRELSRISVKNQLMAFITLVHTIQENNNRLLEAEEREADAAEAEAEAPAPEAMTSLIHRSLSFV